MCRGRWLVGASCCCDSRREGGVACFGTGDLAGGNRSPELGHGAPGGYKQERPAWPAKLTCAPLGACGCNCCHAASGKMDAGAAGRP